MHVLILANHLRCDFNYTISRPFKAVQSIANKYSNDECSQLEKFYSVYISFWKKKEKGKMKNGNSLIFT